MCLCFFHHAPTQLHQQVFLHYPSTYNLKLNSSAIYRAGHTFMGPHQPRDKHKMYKYKVCVVHESEDDVNQCMEQIML